MLAKEVQSTKYQTGMYSLHALIVCRPPFKFCLTFPIFSNCTEVSWNNLYGQTVQWLKKEVLSNPDFKETTNCPFEFDLEFRHITLKKAQKIPGLRMCVIFGTRTIIDCEVTGLSKEQPKWTCSQVESIQIKRSIQQLKEQFVEF